jgi:hypothetical protein
MNDTLLLDPVRVLRGPGHSVQLGAVLINQGVLVGFDDEARQQALAWASRPAQHRINWSPPAWWIRIPSLKPPSVAIKKQP